MSEHREVKNIFNANLIDGNVVLDISSRDPKLVAFALKLLDLEFQNWMFALQMQQKAKKIVVPQPVISSSLIKELRGE